MSSKGLEDGSRFGNQSELLCAQDEPKCAAAFQPKFASESPCRKIIDYWGSLEREGQGQDTRLSGSKPSLRDLFRYIHDFDVVKPGKRLDRENGGVSAIPSRNFLDYGNRNQDSFCVVLEDLEESDSAQEDQR